MAEEVRCSSNEGEEVTDSKDNTVGEKRDSSSEGASREPDHESAATPRDEDSATEYPGPARLAVIVVAISFSVFISGLDENIVSTAIPRITDTFDSFDDVGWYGAAYLLPFATFQIAWGNIYTAFSVKWTYVVSVLIFEAGSLLAGLAPTSGALIAGRVISGFGAAGFLSGVFIMIAHAVPLRQRPLFTTLTSLVFGVAAAAGPLLGGALTQRASWRWCFFINIPFGVIAAVLVAVALQEKSLSRKQQEPEKSKIQKLKEFDYVGVVLFVGSLTCLLLGLQLGGSTYAWSNGRIIALLALFVVLFVVFVCWQWKIGERATIPGRMIKQRTVICCTIYVFCLSGAMEQLYYFLPIWYQAVRGVTPLQSGIDTLGLVLAYVAGGVVSGLLVTAWGYYSPFLIAGTIFCAIGTGLCTLLKPSSSNGMAIGFEVVAGLGVGLGLDLSQIAVQTVSASMDDIPVRTAIIISAQILGSAVFLPLGNTILDTTLVHILEDKLPQIDAHSVVSSGATKFIESLSVADQVLARDAYSTAIGNTWYLGVALAAMTLIASLGIEWKSVKSEEDKSEQGTTGSRDEEGHTSKT